MKLTALGGSRLTEFVGGVVLASIARGLFWIVLVVQQLLGERVAPLDAPALVVGQALLALVLSAVYEVDRDLDPNGWSWPDYRQRIPGVVLGLAAWVVLT